MKMKMRMRMMRMRMRMRMSGYSARTLLFGLFRLLLLLFMDSSGSAGIGLERVPDIRMALSGMMYVWALPPSPSLSLPLPPSPPLSQYSISLLLLAAIRCIRQPNAARAVRSLLLGHLVDHLRQSLSLLRITVILYSHKVYKQPSLLHLLPYVLCQHVRQRRTSERAFKKTC